VETTVHLLNKKEPKWLIHFSYNRLSIGRSLTFRWQYLGYFSITVEFISKRVGFIWSNSQVRYWLNVIPYMGMLQLYVYEICFYNSCINTLGYKMHCSPINGKITALILWNMFYGPCTNKLEYTMHYGLINENITVLVLWNIMFYIS